MARTSAQRQEIAGEGDRALAGQLRLLEASRAEVEALRRRSGEPDDGLANDLAGIRFVLRAALLAGGLTRAKREELERSEREARDLLRRVIAGTEGAGGGGAPRPDLARNSPVPACHRLGSNDPWRKGLSPHDYGVSDPMGPF